MRSSKAKTFSLKRLLNPSFWEKLSFSEKKDDFYQKQDFWNLIAEDYDELEETPFYQFLQTDILEEMERRGALNSSYTFLDVGCGTGNYTIKIADKVSLVYALDYSPSMLNILRKKLEEKRIQNVLVLEEDWRKYKPDRSFDTVFVSMTPILRDLKEVKRLYKLADKFLILVSWAGLRKNFFLEEIEKKFFKKIKENKKPGIFLLFNYFYTLGIPGDVKFYEGFLERKISLERIWKRFKLRLEAKGYKIGPRKEREILKFLESFTKDGKLEVKTKVRIGALFIKKGGREWKE